MALSINNNLFIVLGLKRNKIFIIFLFCKFTQNKHQRIQIKKEIQINLIFTLLHIGRQKKKSINIQYCK